MACRISSTFRLLHRLPTTSVLSRPSRLWGPQPLSFFASTEAPAASSTWTTSRWPSWAAKSSGSLPRSGGRRWRWRRDAPSHMSCFGGFRVWKTGSLVMFGPPFLNETCITAHQNQDQVIGKSHLCSATHCKPDQRFTITHYNLILKKKHTANTIEFHPEPLRIILSSVTYPQHPATQTCNCCILVVDFSTWNRVKYTEDSWNEAPKTGSKLNGVSHLFHISPVAPPSHHVRPVASVPSLRAAAVVVLRLDGGAGGQQHLDHLQVAFPSRIRQRPVASGSADDGDTTRKVNGGSCSDWNPYQQRIGKSQLRNYNKFLNLQAYPSQVSAILVDLLQGVGVHLQQASDSSDVAFFCSLQDVSASKPKLWMSGSVWRSKVYS